MRTTQARRLKHRKFENSESGQTTILVVLVLGLFLLASLAFAVDLSNMWFRRQAAQTAADAACVAGATDLLFTANGQSVPAKAGFTTPGAGKTTGSDCSTGGKPGAVMCTYAKYNGYTATPSGLSTTAASNSVSWTFPALGSVTGATDPPAAEGVANPYINVVVTENVKTWFMGLLGRNYQKVNATCTCGVQSVKSAPPLLVLDPAASASLQITPGATITIVGGPSRSIEVDSTSASAQTQAGQIDTSHGGPPNPTVPTGSDVAVVGNETTLAATFAAGTPGSGTTGNYLPNALPITDPYIAVPAPTLAGTTNPAPTPVMYHDAIYNCPDPANCQLFSPGHYTKTLTVKSGTVTTGLFSPGLYYMDADLDASGTGTTMRMAYNNNNTTSQLDGVFFYFNSGIPKITGTPTSFAAADQVPTKLMQCDASAPLPTFGGAPYDLPAKLDGTVLWAPCTANGTYYQAPSTDTLATAATASAATRGLLIFYGHNNKANPQPDLTGQGQMAFSGSLYFSLASAGGSVQLKLSGGAGSGTEVLGQIVTDQLKTSGNGVVKMALNTKKIANILKVAMLQ